MKQDLTKIVQIRRWLSQPDVYDTFEEIAAKYKIPEERVEEFLDLTDAVLKGRIAIGKMPEMVEAAFGVDAEISKKLSADLAGHRFLPLTAFLPGVEGQMKKWGASVDDYPDFRVSSEMHVNEEVAKRILARHNVELAPELMRRFVFLIKGFLSGESTDKETITLITRNSNIGGLEMGKEAAEGLVTELKVERDQMKGVKVKTVPILSLPADQAGERSEPKDLRGKSKEGASILSEENVESKDLREKLSKAIPPPTAKPVELPKSIPPPPKPKKSLLPAVTATHALTKEVPVISGKKIKSNVSNNKALKTALALFKRKGLDEKTFNEVVNGHVKGLRDPLRTEQLLKDKYNFSEKEVDELMLILEKARISSQGYKSEKKKRVVKKSRYEKNIDQTKIINTKEKAVLNKRHSALTRKISDKTIRPVAVNARVSAARTKEEELAIQDKKINPKRVIEAKQASRPRKAKAKLSKPSSAPVKKDLPKVTDVTYKQRLVGPVQELGTLTLADFRRMSSDPTEAARKVLDKLHLLEGMAFEERMKGVKAWRNSPISVLYIAMAREALMGGTSIHEVATARRNSSKESLSPAEIQAIIKLNSAMKF